MNMESCNAHMMWLLGYGAGAAARAHNTRLPDIGSLTAFPLLSLALTSPPPPLSHASNARVHVPPFFLRLHAPARH